MKSILNILFLLCLGFGLHAQTNNTESDKWIQKLDDAYKKSVPYALDIEIEMSNIPLKSEMPDQLKYKWIQGDGFIYSKIGGMETVLTSKGMLKIEHKKKKIYFSEAETLKEESFLSDMLKLMGGDIALSDSVTVQKSKGKVTLKFVENALKSTDYYINSKTTKLMGVKQITALPTTTLPDMIIDVNIVNQESNIKDVSRYMISYFGNIDESKGFIPHVRFSDYDMISY